MEGQTTLVRDEEYMGRELEQQLSRYDHWNANWLRNFLGDILTLEEVRKTGNGIIKDLVGIAHNVHMANIDIDYSPQPGALGLNALDKYSKSIKTEVVKRAFENDLYGYVSPDARAYAKQHGLELTGLVIA